MRSCRDLPAHPGHKQDAPRDSMVCLGNIQDPKLTRYDTQKHKEIGSARVIGTGWHPSRCVRSGRSRARVAHSGRRMLRAARQRARIRALGQKALRGVAVRPRHRSQQPGMSRKVTEPGENSTRRSRSARLVAAAGRTTSRCQWQSHTRAEAAMAAKPSLATSRLAQPEWHAKPCVYPCGHARAGASTVRRGARKRHALAAASATCDSACEHMKSVLSAEPTRSEWDAG